jgi:tetrahedral aminopeptidase
MAGETMYEILKTLSELPGPGGDEGLVQNFLARRWAPQVERLWISPVGNLMAHVGGKGPKLMVAAHADEISFVVKSIGADGYLWITSGERDSTQRPSLRSPQFLPWGQPALILTTSGAVEGLFATLTGHILNADQREKTRPDWTDIFVDIGASSQAQAEARGVKIGDRIIWNPVTRRIGDVVYGKAMDDRVGLAIMDRLLEVLDRDRLAYDLTFVSTVQEEIGLIGAESAAVESGCEMAIALDIGLTGDVPGVDQRDVSVRLGAGPTIVHKDLSHYNRQFTLDLIHTAREAGIPVQPAVFGVYGSDSSAFTRHGLKAALVVVPTRYTHSPFEMLHLHDVEQTVALMQAFLQQPAAKA